MKREEIKSIFAEATDEQLKQIMDLNGADIEKAKAKVKDIEAKLKEKTEAFDTLNTEFENLKSSNADGAEWKSKFEALKAENDAKEKQAEAERILNEKNEIISKRFSEAVGDKEFSHEAIKELYLKKFGEALDLEENQGKADKDVFHALIKDDATAFKSGTKIELAGGSARPIGKYKSKAEILAIKDGATRRAEMVNNPQFFPELN